MKRLNNDWEYTSVWSEEFLQGGAYEEIVRLPHTYNEAPLHYADPKDYEKTAGYRKQIEIPEEYRGRRLFLQLDGAAHQAEVYVNGKKMGAHFCGYTAFRVEITLAVKFGVLNTIVIKVDAHEDGRIPPFGFVIDYLIYGGLYRDVWLDVRNKTFISDVYVTTPTVTDAHIRVDQNGPLAESEYRIRIQDKAGFTLRDATLAGTKKEIDLHCGAARPWQLHDPVLYTCVVELLIGGKVADRVEKTFGFRTVAFNSNEFLLNGKPVFLGGLNRHQWYPYMGYAAPQALQEEDARILKEELQVNAVRTSHYPQSHYFLDACDRLGLLVFTEIPGWQHIGDEAWQDQAVQNTREMIMQYRQHPSIFLWGVRINESQDNDEFYTRTNRLAHMLDPYRPTSGVRYLEKSSLLEDVYGYNDFSHNGTNLGAKSKKDVSPDEEKPLLITEANGHMFPTKAFDPWEKRQEHALRHARVLNAAKQDGTHAGVFQWCMFDYPTHQDFGSGDRICYHGVMDMFRNPKLAAAVYASQGDGHPVLEVGTSMDIGDYPAGQIGDFHVFTNADAVLLYKNDQLVRSFTTHGWEGLRHGPVLINDTIGRLLQENEGFPEEEAKLIRECLLAAARYGLPNLPLKYKGMLGYAMARYHLKFEDGYNLYGKYVGNWGGEATRWRFDAVKRGKVVASVTKAPDTDLHLEVTAGSSVLHEGETWDAAAVRIRIVDGNGNLAPYAQLPVHLLVGGAGELIGPDVVTAEGGMCGTYIRTNGTEGKILLTVQADGLKPVHKTWTVEKRDTE